MKIKLTKAVKFKDHDELEEGSVVEVSDEVGKTLIDGEQAEEYVQKEEKKEIEMEVKEILDEKEEVEDEDIAEDGAKIEVKKESKGFSNILDAVKALASGKVKEITCKAVTGLNETTAADGGNLVDTPLINKIFGFAMQGAVIAPKCMKYTTGPNANGNKITYLDNGGTIGQTQMPRGYWLAEGAQKTASKFAYGQHDLTLGKLVYYIPFSDEILEDVPTLESWVMAHIKGKMAWDVDNAILNLSTATSGMMGILDAGSANFIATPVAHAAPWTGPIVYDVISGVMPSLRGGAEWYMSNSSWSNIAGDLGGGTTTSTVPLADLRLQTLAGYKVNVMEQLGAFGAGEVVFGNFGEGYVLADKGEVKIDMSKDIRFDYDETVLRVVYRVLGAPVVREQTLPDATVVAAFSTTS